MPCESFVLENSNDAPFALKGVVNNVVSNGVPAAAITSVTDDVANDLRLVAPGQVVTDTTASGCFPDGTKVIAVWPIKHVIYVSNPAACTSSGSTHDIQFTDSSPPENPPDCTHDDVSHRCMIFDAGFRFGDGIDIHDSGGASVDDCSVLEHMVEFHMNTGANNPRLTNCESVSNVSLPERNLDSLNHPELGDDYDRQNIISLLIDGGNGTPAPPPPDANAGACEVKIINSRLGQHRPVGVVVNSPCDHADDLANIGFGMENFQDNAITVENDNGVVQMVNSHSSGANFFNSQESSLYVSNLHAQNVMLYQENAAAAAASHGCGNVFAAPTPYLCAPSSFTQLPGGRLTLVQGQPVMTADTTATNVYYAPYVSQQIPLYSPSSGTFGLIDMTPAGLSLNLASHYTASTLFDVFAGIDGSDGTIKLCSNAWNSSGAGSSARSAIGGVTPVNGVWVNQSEIAGCYHNSTDMMDCQPLTCTYLGSFYVGLTAGQVSQQFGPVSGSGGGAPCLCLYNAYNRVTLTSKSLDTAGSYSYAGSGSSTFLWRNMNGSANNSITVVDGLQQMQILAQLIDAMSVTAMTKTAGIGLDLNSSGTPPQPNPMAQTKSTASASYSPSLTNPLVLGRWVIQAAEGAAGTGSANFGGASLQQLSVQVAD
jgi:hypothetical protein